MHLIRKALCRRRIVSRQQVRLYAGGHGHGHGHGQVAPTEVPVNTPEYFQKYFGYLADPKNLPEKNWAAQALTTRGVLECIAEINSTEFKVKSLNAKNLKMTYIEQYATFVNSKRALLEQQGVSARVIENLQTIYKLRAWVPLWELEQAIEETGFLGEHKQKFRVTRGILEDYPSWKKFQMMALNTQYFDPAYDTSNDPNKRGTNEAEAHVNVERIRGVQGLIKAVQRGLTKEEKQHIVGVLRNSFLTAEAAKEVEDAVASIKELARANPEKAVQLAIDTAEKFPPGTPKRAHYMKLIMVESTDVSNNVEVASSHLGGKNPAALSEIQALLDQADPSKAALVEQFKKALAVATDPAEQADNELILLLSKAELSKQQEMEILSQFSDRTESDELLNDVMNPHLIAARLWGDRVEKLHHDNVKYLQTFQEGSSTTFPDVSSSPKFEKQLADKTAGIISPSPIHPPFNTAVEEIAHMKLYRLASEFYGYDLETPLGLAQLDLLVNDFDVSPGEDTVERTQDYPPSFHTFDELPIIKYDGYNEFPDRHNE
eukprot:TRINITY_DN9653_c0_g1_i1.p1 TRINITY_DN9653_c0_g1~~TRINITY_DN9653_c0_g1_i1.p1  ORF type:complete len:546 (+),score=155.49 TRINITY_DN9653_c0_g1_i1:79-1716(+)